MELSLKHGAVLLMKYQKYLVSKRQTNLSEIYEKFKIQIYDYWATDTFGFWKYLFSLQAWRVRAKLEYDLQETSG